MKIRLIKDWHKPSGKVIRQGSEFHVTMEFGAEMIAQKLAKRVSDKTKNIFKKDDKKIEENK